MCDVAQEKARVTNQIRRGYTVEGKLTITDHQKLTLFFSYLRANELGECVDPFHIQDDERDACRCGAYQKDNPDLIQT